MEKLKKLISIGLIAMAFAIPFTVFAEEKNYLAEEEVMAISEKVGARYGICPEFLTAIAFYESSYCPEARNGNCIGLMQVNPKWHEDRIAQYGARNLYDPYQNMLIAGDYLLELFEEHEDPGMVLMTYNGDSKADDYWNGTAELSEYASKILELSAELEREHGK